MTKMTIGVYKSNKNAGFNRFHRKNTSKHWKHYFLDDETGEWKFNTEWVDSIKAQFLKLKKRHKRLYTCSNCTRFFYGFVKNSREKINCPICADDEELEDDE